MRDENLREDENIEPEKSKKYTLAELLAQGGGDSPLSEEEIEWLSDPAYGRELI